MRWLTYFIFAYIALGVQIGLAPYLRFHGAAPGFVLLAAVFIAMNAPRRAALVGCFVLGLMHDLISPHPPGLYALAYGFVAMTIVPTHNVVSPDHPVAHAVFTLIGGLIAAIVLAVHGRFYPLAPASITAGQEVPATHLSLGTQLLAALYTALLAPILLGILRRIRRVFAFQLERMKISRVEDAIR